MNLIKRIYCRAFQTVFKLAIPILPYRLPKILNSVDEIASLLVSKKVSSVLLITDNFLRTSKLTENLEKLLEQNNIKCAVYDKTQANPTIINVEEARGLYIQNGCQMIIAFGGGSPMDCAKAVGARIACPNRSINQLKGILKVWKKIPTLIAIPTTAGTGSEVTVASLITDSETKHKCTINSFPLIPHYAVLDPVITYSLPKHLTSTTGLDALTHAVEAYIGNSTTQQTRECALEATRMIFENISIAYNDGTNYEARKNMLNASHKAGIAFTKSYVGYVHAIAHTLGGQYNIAHGLANAVLLPVVLEEYGDKIYRKLYELALYVGICEKEDSYEVGAKKFIASIKELNRTLNIPTSFKDIVDEDIPLMARHADKEANPLYPVPMLWDIEKLEKIYHKVKE